jgi:hypothetical protein
MSVAAQIDVLDQALLTSLSMHHHDFLKFVLFKVKRCSS